MGKPRKNSRKKLPTSDSPIFVTVDTPPATEDDQQDTSSPVGPPSSSDGSLMEDMNNFGPDRPVRTSRNSAPSYKLSNISVVRPRKADKKSQRPSPRVAARSKKNKNKQRLVLSKRRKETILGFLIGAVSGLKTTSRPAASTTTTTAAAPVAGRSNAESESLVELKKKLLAHLKERPEDDTVTMNVLNGWLQTPECSELIERFNEIPNQVKNVKKSSTFSETAQVRATTSSANESPEAGTSSEEEGSEEQSTIVSGNSSNGDDETTEDVKLTDEEGNFIPRTPPGEYPMREFFQRIHRHVDEMREQYANVENNGQAAEQESVQVFSNLLNVLVFHVENFMHPNRNA